ncbi:uncharacterized protein EI97DRAFT_498141 [Westerdykella ornata]|uniref:Mid2 domain-containing protein n=1 Tax=Westerdykella ornata TaxID=318751 RepID=A0A6A6K0K5_WESOR|nr:uncharacterized protein EI97DRAFT_498141 [Westerdykella ornata]KAF2281586.1 hypothetical protein EI97DRAFT_498141 [Westerdykella ornata]
MSSCAFSLVTLLLLFFELVVARDNGFTYPPHSFTNDGLEGSDIVLVVGEKVTLRWETDYIEPITIWQYQWKRDRTAEPRFYAVKLLENTANSPQPKSLSWTAAPVNTSDPDWPNQLTHFNALIFNGFGFNSRTIRVVEDQAAAASISRAFSLTATGGGTPSSSMVTDGALPSTTQAPPLSGDASTVENGKSGETRTLGMALGLGLGIPLLVLLGVLAACWVCRRRIVARYRLSSVPAISGAVPASAEKEVYNSPPVPGSDSDGWNGHGQGRCEVDAGSVARHEVPG